MTEQIRPKRLVPFLKSFGPGHVYGGLGAILPALSVVSAVAAPVMLIVLTAIMAGHVALRENRVPVLAWPLAAMAALFFLYATISSAWAIEPAESLWTGVRLAGLFASGLFLLAAVQTVPDAGRRTAGNLLIVGMIAGMGFFAVELLSGGGITYAIREATGAPPKAFSILFNRTASVFALFIWPALIVLALRRRFLAGAALLLASAWLASLTESGASLIGLAAGIAAAGLVGLAGPVVLRICAFLAAACTVAAPLLVMAAHRLPVLADAIAGASSFGHRLRIWQYSVDKTLEHPLVGWGLDAARHLGTGGYETGKNADLMPLHPHNIPLQIWLELGLVGAVLAAVFFAAAGVRASRLKPGRIALALVAGSMVSAICIIGLSYGAWQWWWLSTLWLAAAMTAAVLPVAARSGAGS